VPLDWTRVVPSSKLGSTARSWVVYVYGPLSAPAISLTSVPPDRCRTTCATDTPTSPTTPAPCSLATQIVAAGPCSEASVLQLASTTEPADPFDVLTSCPASTASAATLPRKPLP
jgi:hypothetical protein